MGNTTQSQVFFLISSIGFVTLWVLVGVFLYYAIKAVKSFSRIINKIEKDIGEIGDTSKEMVEDIRESTIFQFLFGTGAFW